MGCHRTDTTSCYFLSDYLDDCPSRKMVYAYRRCMFKGEAEHIIYSMEKQLDWMKDDHGNPQWQVTEGGNSWSDFESSYSFVGGRHLSVRRQCGQIVIFRCVS